MHSNYSIYDALYDEAQRKGWPGWGGKTRIAKGPDQVARILEKPYVPSSGKVIELGCGEGHLCRLLAVRGYSVTGIDVSSKAIEWALEKEGDQKNITYVQGNLCHSEVLSGECYDLVVDGNCLHCILGEDRPLFLENVQRLLAERGILFVSSLCSKSDQSVTLMHARQPYRHVASISRLLSELENAQFQVLEWVVNERENHNHINVFARKSG
jgi:2-polyprenyl-3-methyl-5-hydroxy-6-metoxy-1,4-benzoquinol methylase